MCQPIRGEDYLYKNLRSARNAAGSTSGMVISSSEVARVELNMASNTALPTLNTNL